MYLTKTVFSIFCNVFKNKFATRSVQSTGMGSNQNSLYTCILFSYRSKSIILMWIVVASPSLAQSHLLCQQFPLSSVSLSLASHFQPGEFVCLFLASFKTSMLIQSKFIGRGSLQMTSRQPYWCSETMKLRPCWCFKQILWELNSFIM